MKEKKLTITDLDESLEKSNPKVEEKSEVILESVKLPEDAKPAPKQRGLRWHNLNKVQKVAIASLPFLILLLIPAYIFYDLLTYTPVYPSDILDIDGPYIAADTLDRVFPSYAITNLSEPRTEESPINGARFTKSEFEKIEQRRPVAVMINNHPGARPQSGLSDADIVYETLVEGGYTRYMAIYWSNLSQKVGPVRSARQYYLEWLSPYDAIYIHDGYATSEDPKVNAGGNIYNYGIKSISTQGSWRDQSDGREYVHSEYNSVTNAYNIGFKNGWEGLPEGFKAWKFKSDNSKDKLGDTIEASIAFHQRLNQNGINDVRWVYDKDSNSYLRYQGNSADIDQVNNEQIRAKVVIIQFTDVIPTYDDKAHIIVETIGSDKAVVLQDGSTHDIKWNKQDRVSRTLYTNADGSAFSFNRGTIWIEVISNSDSQFDIIEQ